MSVWIIIIIAIIVWIYGQSTDKATKKQREKENKWKLHEKRVYTFGNRYGEYYRNLYHRIGIYENEYLIDWIKEDYIYAVYNNTELKDSLQEKDLKYQNYRKSLLEKHNMDDEELLEFRCVTKLSEIRETITLQNIFYKKIDFSKLKCIFQKEYELKYVNKYYSSTPYNSVQTGDNILLNLLEKGTIACTWDDQFGGTLGEIGVYDTKEISPYFDDKYYITGTANRSYHRSISGHSMSVIVKVYLKNS